MSLQFISDYLVLILIAVLAVMLIAILGYLYGRLQCLNKQLAEILEGVQNAD